MSARELRNFGLTLGLAFAALGGVWLYADRFRNAAIAFVALGGLLLLAGLIAPRALAQPYRAWMAFAELLGGVMTRVILAILYWLVVTPIGFVLKVAGKDLLGRRGAKRASYWVDMTAQRGPRHYEKLY
jgi:hypothetical protein